ncbi:MAG TPA: acyltransferase domain-containing protein [Mobilitalea sp.]|nr:acyltransferase domain-containing protein [Mobilitalea sp.]
MNVRKLCKMIDMPEEVISEIEKWNAEEYKEALEHSWMLVQDKSKWEDALAEVKELLGDDKNGLKCLAFMLHTGLRTYQEYIRKGITEQIYIDTLKCFSRFVREYDESFGSYGFDREWWTVRELTLKEFRLGELEYEMVEKDGHRLVSVHIPSDAKLERKRCRESYKKARSFFMDYASDYAETEYFCDSWLISPKLKELLAETSNIIRFQEDFILDSFEPEATGYMLWVFKNEALSLDEVPQNTSLQRKMKAYLKNGGKIGEGKGHLKEESFE